MAKTSFRSVLVLAALFVTMGVDVFAQSDVAAQFEFRSHTFESTTLPYRLFVPVGYDSTKSYPIVLTLHGSGERGTNNVRHIERNRLATVWADSVNQTSYPTFVVSPQAPQGGTWSTAGCFGCVDTTPLVGELANVMNLLDSLEAEFSLDPNRIYVTGLSLGGFGTWELIARFPERFAAAIPMSGGGDPSKTEEMATVPIWNFHGLSDSVVPAAASRQMIEALLETGRPVVFTDCDFSTCGTIDPAEFQSAMDRHADLLYTEYLGGGHVIWEESYDDPRLLPWVFSQYKRQEGVIEVSNIADYPRLSGDHTLTWLVANSADSVEIWFSERPGEKKQRVSPFVPNAGSYTWNTEQFVDTPLAQLHLYVKNQDGFVYGRHSTTPFIVSNRGPSSPYLALGDSGIDTNDPIVTSSVELFFVATDVESSLLSADLFFSSNGGQTQILIDEFDVTSSPTVQSRSIELGGLPNSRNSLFRLEVSDGDSVSSAMTSTFIKQTDRLTADSSIDHVRGSGVVTIVEHIVDADKRTGHRYRVTFDDSDPDDTRYSVTDLNTSEVKLDSAPLSDGVSESPVFDGLRLVVFESSHGLVDLERTGWVVGDADLAVSVSAGTVNLGGTNVVLSATEEDYDIIITDAVADTSVSKYSLPMRDMRFRVVAASDGGSRNILFKDTPADGIPSPSDIIVILEDIEAIDLPAWLVSFSGNASSILPKDGDVFRIITQKGATSDDVFEFIGGQIVATEEVVAQVGFELLPNYPNPFRSSTVIPFVLDRPGQVTIVIFDALGRRLRTLASSQYPAGRHEVGWDETSGDLISNGVYFVRVEVRNSNGEIATSKTRSVLKIR